MSDAGKVWLIIMTTIAVLSLGVLIFRTQVGVAIWEFLVWLYNGLKDFDFTNIKQLV